MITYICPPLPVPAPHTTCSPVGVFEMDKFATGSRQVLEAVVESTEKGAVTVLGK